MSLLPVPGGILAQLAPAAGQMDPKGLAAIMAMANQQGQQQPAGPGAAIAPPSVQAPTVALNAQPVDHIDGPSMGDVAADLPQADLTAPQHKGILGRMGDTLHDPMFRAQALRFAMGAFNGGAGGGLKAATDFTEGRRAAAEDARRFDAQQALRERATSNEERNTDGTLKHLDRSDATNEGERQDRRYLGILGNATTRRGQDVTERDSIRGNSTSRANNLTSNETERRGQNIGAETTRRGQDIGLTASQGDNAATVAAARVREGQQVKPEDALNGIMPYVPGLIKGFPSDPKAQAEAWADIPSGTQAALAKAYLDANGDPEKFMNSAQSIVGDGASYDDGSGLFNLKDGYKEGAHGGVGHAPAGQSGGNKQIVKTGTDRNTGRKVVQYSDGTIAYAD